MEPFVPFRHVLLALLVVVIWGGNYVATKTSTLHFTPFLNTALRFIILLGVLLPFVRFPRGQARVLLKLSLALGVLHFGLLAASMWFHLDIATCAIAIQMGVPFATLLGAVCLNDRIGRWRSLGMMLCFAGAVVVAGTPNVVAHGDGFLLALLAAFFWGVTNVMMKTMQPMEALPMMYGLSVFSLPLLLVIAYCLEGASLVVLQSAPVEAWMAVVFTALASTLVAYGVWYWLLKHHPISQVTPYNLLTPIFGIAFGQMFFEEALGWRFLLGAAMTLAGVAIIVIRRPRTAVMAE